MAILFRDPLYVPILRPRPRQDWSGPNLIISTLNQAGAHPFRHRDFPNPVRLVVQRQDMAWLPNLLETTLAIVTGDPFTPDDYPNPNLRKRTIPTPLSWRPTSNAQDNTPPFSQDEWPNPRIVFNLIIPFSWRPTAAVPVRVDLPTTPFVPVDFPNPHPRALIPTPLVSRAMSRIIAADPATLLIEWPNPQVRVYRQPVDLMPSPLGYTLQVANPFPFSQDEWPNPTLRARSQENLFGWNPIMQHPLSVVNTMPFSMADWPNPLGARPVQQKDFEYNGTIYMTPPPPSPIRMKKTLSVIGSRVKERQVHFPGDL